MKRQRVIVSATPPGAAAARCDHTSVATVMAPADIQSVMLAWLLALELGRPVARFGVTQMPGQLLMMVGGWGADRVDALRVLIGAQLLAIAPGSGFDNCMLTRPFTQLCRPDPNTQCRPDPNTQ
jgi:hypothetical protein